MTEKIQNRSFSIVKGLGIILIVVCHSAAYTPISTFAYLFNVAVFFFVAGYFFKDENLEKPLLFFRKKVVRLYVPWVLYGLAFVLLHNTFLEFGIIAYDFYQKTAIAPYSFTDIIYKCLDVLTFFKWKEPLLAPLWFLFGLFSGFCVFYSLSWIAKKISPKHFEILRASLIFLTMLLGFSGNAFDLPFSILYRPMVISGLIFLGKLYNIFSDRIKLSPVIALLCLVELIVFTAIDYRINIGGMKFGNPFLFLIISCSGCYMLLTLSRFIHSKWKGVTIVLDYIGRNTLTIMALHYISFKLVMLLQIWIYDYPVKYLAYYPIVPENISHWWIVYTIAGVGIPILLSGIYHVFQTKVTTILR